MTLTMITMLLAVAMPLSAQQSDISAEVRALTRDPSIQRAFQVIEDLEPRSMADLIEMTEIPAPPFGEAARAAVYVRWLREAGADTAYIDEEGNVVAIRRGRQDPRPRRTVGFAGHLDTVFPEGTDVTVKQRGDTLFAPGIGDDTRGLIVVLTVLRAMERAGIETDADVWFVGIVGEEGLGDLRGMKHLFRPGAPKIDAWIDVDGGGIDRIVNAGLGSHRYRVTFRGPGGHSWGAFGMANPAHAQARAVHHFVQVADTLTRSGPRTSYNVGVVAGGTSVNSIPFEVMMEVDMRSEDPASLDRIDAAFQAAMRRGLAEENAVRRSGPALELDVEQVGDRPSGTQPASLPLVQRALAAARALGGSPSLAMSSTDSNIPISLGVPAVTIGRGGDGGGGHSPGEWWRNENGTLAIRNALLLLVSEAGLALTAYGR
ncbi:MAG: M20/M25/M40 family metallo-hydrolase [Gemmatimonadota bacterium]|jgi:acetylornithine deacetylase/succinyl-diaminopimelate desuccinylase-like protein